MSVTPKEQFEDAIAENARLRRELEAAQAESAEARGNVEKALRELSEEVAKRHKVEAKCAEMRSCIAWLNSHRQSPLETAWNDHVQHALSSDCGKDYVSRAVVDQLVEALEKVRGYGRSDMGHQSMCDYVTETAEEALAAAKSLEVL